jgi:transposase
MPPTLWPIPDYPNLELANRFAEPRGGSKEKIQGRFLTEKQFVSHVTLIPHKPMSGGKPVRKKRRSSASTRVAAALRMAALSLRNSATALGAYYRKIARRLNGDVAVFATARKLATLIYRLLRWGQPYVDEGAEAFERRYQETRLKNLKAKAKELGYQLLASN